jgi:HAD superfamily hydrolase (TIGR01509 family)
MDTIIPDPFYSTVKILTGTLENFSKVINPKAWVKFEMGLIDENRYREMFFNKSISSGKVPFTFDEFKKNLLNTPAPYPDVLKLLKRFSKKIPFYLASNYCIWVHQHINNIDIKKYFKGEFISYQLRTRKPSKKFFKTVLKKINLPPSEVLIVDDQNDNIEMAEQLGFLILKAKSNWPGRAEKMLKKSI